MRFESLSRWNALQQVNCLPTVDAFVGTQDKISAATRKLKLTDVAHDTASENAASEVETKQDSANHTKYVYYPKIPIACVAECNCYIMSLALSLNSAFFLVDSLQIVCHRRALRIERQFI